jgi:hypothetical protein
MTAISFAETKHQLYLMKNYFFAAVAASALLFSCKKNDKTSCDNTVAALTGNYKITKVTMAGQSVIDMYFSEACQKDDVYQLKADKTMAYSDAGTQCSPADNGTGTWDVVNGVITIAHTSSADDVDGTVTNKCNGFEVTQDMGSGIKYVITFSKQ